MIDPSLLIGSSTIPTTVGVTADDASDPGSANLLQATEQKLAVASLQAQILAATVQILSQLDLCIDSSQAAQQAVTDLAATLPPYRVQIAWRDMPESPCRLVADSRHAESESQHWQAAAEEIAYRGDVTVFPATDRVHLHALLAVAKFAHSESVAEVVGIPLTDSQGLNRGALLAFHETLIDKKPGSGHNGDDGCHAVAHFQAIASGLTNKLLSLQSFQPRRWEKAVRSVTTGLSAHRRRWAIVVGIAATAAMLTPVPYKIAAKCELQPVQRRVIAAPFDGPLESVQVRPGDIVDAGEILASLNPREIDYQLAGLDAELRRAIQEKKGLIAQHDSSGSELAALEAKRLQFQQDLLNHRRGNLQIRSPLAGMVVAGDLKPSVGSPLAKGDTLFEIAPLEEIVVEISIPESDFVHVREQMSVQIWLDAIHSQVFTGTIGHIHPSAELRDGNNVFIAEVRLDNADGPLRPGMRGRVRVVGDSHPLGWNLFHHAYYSLRMTLGW